MFDIFEEDETGMWSTPKRLLIVDGTYSMYRAFYGYNVDSFHTQAGLANNCIFGIAKQILNLKRDLKPTHIAFAYDVSRAGYRKELLPQYKEGRAETPEELKAQREPVKEMLRSANIPIIEQERLEADDIIATLATQAAGKGWSVDIFSSDKDMHQLLNERIQIVRPSRAQNGWDVMTVDKLLQKYQLTPQQYADFAALVGESADNIPGLLGVGPKTATAWILEYGDLENIIANADKIALKQKKLGAVLTEGADLVRLNRKVNQLICDAELGIELNALKIVEPNKPKCDEFFKLWEIPSLVGKFNWKAVD